MQVVKYSASCPRFATCPEKHIFVVVRPQGDDDMDVLRGLGTAVLTGEPTDEAWASLKHQHHVAGVGATRDLEVGGLYVVTLQNPDALSILLRYLAQQEKEASSTCGWIDTLERWLPKSSAPQPALSR